MVAIRPFVSLALASVVLVTLSAQATEPRFEVVSIKPNNSADLEVGVAALPSGRLKLTNLPLSTLVLTAYELQDLFQVNGMPDWAQRERFDIEAQAPQGVIVAFPGQGTALPTMLRALLAERMKLVTHTERRDVPMFALVVARADGRLGPGLTRSSVDCTVAPLVPKQSGVNATSSCGNRVTPTSFSGKGIPLERVVRLIIAPRVRQQVVDRTGLTGTFDVELAFRGGAGLPTPGPGDDLPTIETVVQEQLGLRLQPIREPSDVLVIDHIERPTAN